MVKINAVVHSVLYAISQNKQSVTCVGIIEMFEDMVPDAINCGSEYAVIIIMKNCSTDV